MAVISIDKIANRDLAALAPEVEEFWNRLQFALFRAGFCSAYFAIVERWCEPLSTRYVFMTCFED